VQQNAVFVVVPTYNEAGNLKRLADSLFVLPVPNLQLLIVDDNSPDGTGVLAESLKETYVNRVHVIHRERKLGFRTAYVEGFLSGLEKGADVIIQMDADLSHPVTAIPALIEGLLGYDVTVGSRYISGGKVDSSWSVWRHFLSRLGNLYARLILRVPYRDVTSGFKSFRKEALDRINLNSLRCDGFAFQAEMACLTHQAGLEVVEVPIEFTDRVTGDSKLNMGMIWEALWRLPVLTVRIRKFGLGRVTGKNRFLRHKPSISGDGSSISS